MPKKRVYSPEEKKLVRRLLLLHGGDVAVVTELVGFPRRTIERWRARWDDDYQLYNNRLAQNDPWRANANLAAQQLSIPITQPLSPLAQSSDSMAQFAQLRQTLMEHVTALADNLPLHDGSVNQRVQAITRLLDRILALDEILPAAPTLEQPTDPSEQPEQTIRFEYYYDGAPQMLPPWNGASTEEGPLRSLESYLPESHPVYQPPRPIIASDDGDDDHSAAEEETTT
ncbi:MAG: hypothetical protein OXG39_11745 [Chloroflexi bacterium]|nr:hypothetical protein [Chloroflexota bacterium]